jgi:hypothetical protein
MYSFIIFHKNLTTYVNEQANVASRLVKTAQCNKCLSMYGIVCNSHAVKRGPSLNI